MKINFLTSVTIAALLLASACDDDPAKPAVDPPPYQNLSQKGHVLKNLELSYNLRQISEYTKLLDDNFIMYFSSGDVSGGNTPAQWGRADEITAHTNLFNQSYVNGTWPSVTEILLDVEWEDDLAWIEIEPLTAPGEKWYVATLYYDFQLDLGPAFHLINGPGAKAQFTVRNAGTENAPRWQLVEMRDLDGEVAALRASSGTEQYSWGHVKAIYRP